MIRKTLLAAAMLVGSGLAHAGVDVKDLQVIGLTGDQQLISFAAGKANKAVAIGSISGLTTDTSIVGIDYRVQDGKLYGVGNAGGVYTIDTGTAVATLVNNLSVSLSGTQFGVDFNPAADRLRIISNAGQNLRHNVNTGGVTLEDGALNYTPGTTVPGIAAAAYTNNDLDLLTGTSLFDIDPALDQVVLQSPPNNGSLALTGKLAVDTGSAVGFDIYTDLSSTNRNNVNIALASLSVGGVTGMYSINLLTGEAQLFNRFASTFSVTDIAVPLGQQLAP
ncbi:DUF4394 domain-containing protein [Hydrocarboniphaga sp.]|uniref:DUF4394 domain-containing protein n=1 Tax=Hydrocarboniphaga sp. TaxID=2033016 RepID=UPI003D0ADC90